MKPSVEDHQLHACVFMRSGQVPEADPLNFLGISPKGQHHFASRSRKEEILKGNPPELLGLFCSQVLASGPVGLQMASFPFGAWLLADKVGESPASLRESDTQIPCEGGKEDLTPQPP